MWQKFVLTTDIKPWVALQIRLYFGNHVNVCGRNAKPRIQECLLKGLVVRNIEKVSIEMWRCVEIVQLFCCYRTANISVQKLLFILFTY